MVVLPALPELHNILLPNHLHVPLAIVMLLHANGVAFCVLEVKLCAQDRHMPPHLLGASHLHA